MKKRILYTLLSALSLVLFTACGSSESNDTDRLDVEIKDIRLSKSMNQICTDKTSFTLTPSLGDEPIINITQNVKSKITLIEVESNSVGYVTISNCTKG